MQVHLSRREDEIIHLMCDTSIIDASNKALAYRMGLVEGTVKEYLKNLYSKLHVLDRRGVMIWGFQHGIGNLIIGGHNDNA